MKNSYLHKQQLAVVACSKKRTQPHHSEMAVVPQEYAQKVMAGLIVNNAIKLLQTSHLRRPKCR